MRVVLIGAGNLATNLGKALARQEDIEVVQVFSRTIESATKFASLLNCQPVNAYEQVAGDADLYVVSVKDKVLPAVIERVCKGRRQAVFVHTAGSMPMSLFEHHADHYGVFYPMQTFSKDKEVDFKEIPCFVEASDEVAMAAIRRLASVTEHVRELSSSDRKYLHLAAVFACNFVNHCYALSAEVLRSRGIPFEVMLPLIDETARKVHHLPPLDAQTGPAVRFDQNVIDMQEAMLDDELTRELYEKLSKSIYRFYEH